jgi:hypothetical protein
MRSALERKFVVFIIGRPPHEASLIELYNADRGTFIASCAH